METEKMKTPKIHDHLVVRWLERVEGFDLEPIRASIRKRIPESLVAWAGTGTIPGPNGTRIIVRDGIVRTILPPKSKQQGKRA